MTTALLIFGGISFLIYFLILFFRFRLKGFYAFGAILVTVIGIALIIEIGGQVYAYFNPGYYAVWMHPDKILGWKFTPNFEYIQTGKFWYAREFSAKINTNSLGFRDLERSVAKPDNIKRIVLLGDSFISAQQVPFEKTAGQILKKELNNSFKNHRFEVLNFGVDGHGTGQFLLVYNNYAKKFKPDYVFTLIFPLHFWRTITHKNCWISPHFKKWTSGKLKLPKDCLEIRPGFAILPETYTRLSSILNFKSLKTFTSNLKLRHLQNQTGFPIDFNEYQTFIQEQTALITQKTIHDLSYRLGEEPLHYSEIKDFKAFQQLRNDVIRRGFDNRPIIKKPARSVLWSKWKLFKKALHIKNYNYSSLEKERRILITEGYQMKNDGKYRYYNFQRTLYVNLKVLQQLGQSVHSNGNRFILVDASQALTSHIFGRGGSMISSALISRIFKLFAKENQWGYISLSKYLNDAADHGIRTRWKYDGHFNETGNEIFADAMHQWLKNN